MHIDSFNGSSIICVDFNLPNINWDLGASLGDNRHDLFIDLFNQYGLYQSVKSPTRDSNILNIVLSNAENVVTRVNVGQPIANCDHCCLV